MTKTLTEIQSIHESREFDPLTRKVEKNCLIEVNDFDVVTEEVKIIEQYEVLDIKKEEKDNREHYEITCKRKDFEKERIMKEELVMKIIEKHYDILKSSFVKCLVDGIDSQSMKTLKQMLFKLRGDINEDF